MMKIVGHIVFSGDLDDPPDPDAAEIELRKAGYTIARMPERFRPLLYHPLDYFVQAIAEGVVSDEDKVVRAVMDEINHIVNGHGGNCMEGGFEAPDYDPSSEFDLLFAPKLGH
jgi:hypothetical protein